MPDLRRHLQARVAVLVLALLPACQGSSSDSLHDERARRCTEAVNELNQVNIRDGYPGYSQREAARIYDQCMTRAEAGTTP